jgi:hypothetical protein
VLCLRHSLRCSFHSALDKPIPPNDDQMLSSGREKTPILHIVVLPFVLWIQMLPSLLQYLRTHLRNRLGLSGLRLPAFPIIGIFGLARYSCHDAERRSPGNWESSSRNASGDTPYRCLILPWRSSRPSVSARDRSTNSVEKQQSSRRTLGLFDDFTSLGKKTEGSRPISPPCPQHVHHLRERRGSHLPSIQNAADRFAIKPSLFGCFPRSTRADLRY